MRINIRLITQDLITQHKSNELVYQDGWVYTENIRGMHGLPQSGILSNNLLAQHLKIMDIIKSNAYQYYYNMYGDLFH